MTLQEQLLDLDVTASQISKGINAVVLMTMGLDEVLEPCADGFDVVCDYLTGASQTLRSQIDACLQAVRQ